MYTVIIRLPGEDFCAAIVTMREWLERNQCEPTRYRYDQSEETVVMSVDFAARAQAEAFARRFDGQSGQPAPTIFTGNSPHLYSDDTSATTPLHDLQYDLSRSSEPAPRL
jgi:hypothetical protein